MDFVGFCSVSKKDGSGSCRRMNFLFEKSPFVFCERIDGVSTIVGVGTKACHKKGVHPMHQKKMEEGEENRQNAIYV